TFFASFALSGHYYFNNASSQFSGDEPRYTLSQDNPADGWFYATLAQDKDFQINISQDQHIKETRVWINALVRSGHEAVGIVGTGIPLSEFLAETVNLTQPGIHNFFIDDALSIKLSSDTRFIDYASIAKKAEQRSTMNALLKPADIKKLQQALIQLKEGDSNDIANIWVEFDGRVFLLGVARLPEIGWYDLTLLDQKNLGVMKEFFYVPYAMGALFLLVLLTLGFALHQWILQPIMSLKIASDAIQAGNFEVMPPLVGEGEVADLSRSFRHMVAFVRNTHRELEERVKERTEALHRLTEIDVLTGLLNRRGIMDRFDNELARLARNGGSLGLLLLDLDHFKDVNDTYGHAAGDLALTETSRVIESLNRPYDYAGRYGGEEFLVILPGCDSEDLLAIAERVRGAIAALRLEYEGRPFSFTTSIGMYHVRQPEARDAMLSKTDKALYLAKVAGRNCVRMYVEAPE
ncbi:MAG: diguanylate cyclase, partial [Burkholderiales bacterium]